MQSNFRQFAHGGKQVANILTDSRQGCQKRSTINKNPQGARKLPGSAHLFRHRRHVADRLAQRVRLAHDQAAHILFHHTFLDQNMDRP